MRHAPDGELRRLDDEPLAVADRVTDHVVRCRRCTARHAQIVQDSERAAQLLAPPLPMPDVDVAWARLRRELGSGQADGDDERSPGGAVHPGRPRWPRLSLRTGLAVAAVAAVIAGTAAAATLSTIFAPTRVAPVTLDQNDVRAIAAFAGLANGHTLAGFAAPNGSSRLRFGTVTWSAGSAQPASSLGLAAAEAGFPVTLPARLPAGVGAIRQLILQPRAKAAVIFNSAAASLAGSSVTLDAGPAVVAAYTGAHGAEVPTLGVATMRRPTARSSGASLTQIEAFLLRQPGVPPELAEELRLLGDLRTTLPVPVPPGISVRSVQIAGWPGVVLTDASNAASAVFWEDGRGLLHTVAGLLDARDVLNVADQVG